MASGDATWLSHSQAEAAFRSGDRKAICSALASAALTDYDRTWLESWCIVLAAHEDAEVRRLAATCLGHVARRFRSVDDTMLAALERLRDDPAAQTYAEDALADVRAVLEASA